MLKIGLVGGGAIGSELARAVQARFSKVGRIVYLSDQNQKAARFLAKRFKLSYQILSH